MMLTSEKKFLLDSIGEIKSDNKIVLPSELARQRFLPRTITENPGFFDPDNIPYNTEILDNIHPDSPVTHISVRKSVQSGETTSWFENAILFWILNHLGSIVYFTSTQNAGRIRSSSAIDILIDNSPLKPMVKPLSDRNRRKTGDSTMYKEIGSSKLLIASYNSIGDMKSHTFNLILNDEKDECPPEIRKQGNTAGIIEGRTIAASFYKICNLSTASMADESMIEQDFIEGDQRKYYVLCPYCGEAQELVIKRAGQEHGLTFSTIKTESGAIQIDPRSIRYICISCHAEIFEAQKMQMLRSGQWIPTWQKTEHKPKDENRRSYHIHGIMSPYLSWGRLLNEFKITDYGKDLLKFKNFIINYCGEAYKYVQKQANWKIFYSRLENYVLGEYPPIDDYLLIFGGVDVQLDRLELAIYGFKENMESYLLDYQVFWGDCSLPDDPVWGNLYEYVYKKTFVFHGKHLSTVQCGIDCSYDPKHARPKDWTQKAHTVYAFCGKTSGLFIPVKGMPDMSATTHETVKAVKTHEDGMPFRVHVNTHVVKDNIYTYIGKTKGSFCIHWPKYGDNAMNEISEHYAKSLFSEIYRQNKQGGFEWQKIYARNEVLDVTVYAQACAYFNGIDKKDNEFFEQLKRTL